MRRWLQKIVAAILRLRRHPAPRRLDQAATSRLDQPVNNTEVKPLQAAETGPTPSAIEGSGPLQMPAVDPSLELTSAHSTSAAVEDEVADLYEKEEGVAVDTTIAPNTVLMRLEGTMPDRTESGNVPTADGPATRNEIHASDAKPSVQQLTLAQAEISRLDHEDEIPCRERGDVASPFQPTLMSGSVPPVQQLSASQLRCDDAEPVEASRLAIPHDETWNTGEVDTTAVNESEQEIGVDEKLEGPFPVIGIEEELPRTDVSESSTTRSGRKITSVAPEKRGGRPRGSLTADRTEPSEASKRGEQTRNQRPELVCWLQGMTYVVGVEVPEEVQLPLLSVRQPPDVDLEEEDSRSGLWRLKQPLESVEFLATEPDEICAVEIPSARYRIFKMVGTYDTRGRAVRQGSAGQFLIVVPESWRWNEELSGPATTTPEYVYPETCRAHHVELPLEPGRALAFNSPEGTCVRIPCGGQHFEFVGERIDDASADAGPLFAREPPQLRWTAGIAEATTIAAVVLGEEGIVEGRRGWRARADRFEDLRPAIAARRSGWFFVRLYDGHSELIESLDFRFVADLAAIEVEAGRPVPGVEGHSAARIRFRHGRGCSVRNSSPNPVITELVPDGSSAIVPADNESDETSWLVGTGTEQVRVKIRVDRVWWALEGVETGASQLLWTDRPLKLSREDFKATSVVAIRIRLPRPRWAEELRIGFQGSRSRSVHLGASERECVIQLRDLGEARDLEEQAAARLSIWVVPHGRTAERLEGVVGVLPEVGVSLQDDGFLRSLRQLKPRLLMAVLTRVRTACNVPLRHMIRELRSESYERIPKRQRGAACESFVKEGLCLLALAIEQLEVQKMRRMTLPERWLRRARAAQVHFPGVMSAVRSRRREIQADLAAKDGSGTRPRTDRC